MNCATPSAPPASLDAGCTQISSKMPIAQDTSIAHAVQSDTTCEAEFVHSGGLPHVAGAADHDLLGDGLHRGRDVHGVFANFRFRLTSWFAEEIFEFRRDHREPGGVIEIGHVHTERSVVLQIDQVFVDQVGEFWLSEGSEAH